MKRLFKGVDAFIGAMLGNLAPSGIAWARVGIVVMIAAAAMSFNFGVSVSWMHGLFLACLTFIAAFGPEAAYKAVCNRKIAAGIAIAICCIPVLAAEFYSHGAYTAGIRGKNVTEARVQNTKWDGAQDATKEDKANLEMWKKQLASLLEQNAWAATVKAEALREQVVVAQKEIDLEAARGGCKAKCALRMKEKADLEQRIGTIEQASDLSKRIEATQRILDGKRDVAAKTEFKTSAVVFQDASLAKWVALLGYGSTKPTDLIEESSHESANFLMALMGTGLPALSIFIAGLYRKPEDEAEAAMSALSTAKPFSFQKGQAPNNIHQHVAINDVFGKMQTAFMAEKHGRIAA